MTGDIVIVGGTLIDGRGGAPTENSGIRIRDGSIAEVGMAGQMDAGDAMVIDATGQTVLPGFVNCHEHLDLHYSYGAWESRVAQPTSYWVARAARNALIALTGGVTTVRDLASKDGNNIHVKRAIDDGLLIGPRVLASGSPLATTGGHGSEIAITADGADGVRKAARHVLHTGADLIKLLASGDFMVQHGDEPSSPQFTVDEMRAAVEEAHKAGKLVTAHAQPPEAIAWAVEAGVDCIEHGALLDKPTAALLAERGVALVPTLGETFVIAERGEELGKPQWLIEKCRAHSEKRMQAFQFALEAGVKIAVGTDTCDSMADEMELMVRGGMEPADVLVAATRVGAEVCGLGAETGTVEPRKRADLAIVRGDPLVDIRSVASVACVIAGGIPYKPDDLRPAIGVFPL